MLGPLYPDSFAENIVRALDELGVAVTAVDPRSALTRTAFRPNAVRRSIAHLEDLLLKTSRSRGLLVGRPVADRLAAAAPHLVISTVAHLDAQLVETWRRLIPGSSWALWYPDTMANLAGQSPLIAPWDRLFFKDPYLVDILSLRTNLPVHFLPEACLPSRHAQLEPATDEERRRYGCDVAVAGNIYPYRARVLETLPKGVELKLYGNLARSVRHSPVARAYTGEYVTDRSKFLAFTCARVVLNTLHYSEIASVNARLFEATAFGGFVVTHTSPGLAELFEIGKEVVAVDSASDLHAAIVHYLAAPDERSAIAAAGMRRAHVHHTYHQRLRVLGQICGF